ncbi:MAG: DUF1684 domain-containing protein [Acidobacteriota bacterium]|nr:DUF1684 domain-containing protein [Acidobacteriota bacterium]
MSRDLRSTLLLLLLARATMAAAAVPPLKPPPAAAAATATGEYRKEIEDWRADRLKGLRSPDGWLTLVGLFWLEEGENRFGSDPANRVVLPPGKTPPVAGTLIRRGDSVSVRAEPGAGLTSQGKPVSTTTATAVRTDGKAVFRIGSVSFFLIKRGDRLGIRVKDSQSPALAAFRGVDEFPIQPDWRVEARFEPYRPPRQIPVANVLGQTEEQPSPGAVVFEHRGKTYRLDALAGDDNGGLFFIFADQTNGHETYGAGRFLETGPPKDGLVVVDFNKAYDPPCAFTPFATCPLPPAQNRLALRVEAGEKSYHGRDKAH